MRNAEQSYIQKVEDIIAQGKEPIETIGALASMNMPNLYGFSLNSLRIVSTIGDLDFERGDGELDAFSGTDAEYRAIELRVATESLERINRYLSDIRTGNLYKQIFSVDFVYSRLKDGVYSYRNISRLIDSTTEEEANKQRDILKQGAPKVYANEPDFTLEDVRVSGRVVDSSNNPVGIIKGNSVV